MNECSFKVLMLDYYLEYSFSIACFRRVLGCHPHLSCVGEALGAMWSCQSRWLQMRFVPKQAVQHGPACDSLDHRARAFYLPCGLCTMNFVMPLVCAHSWFPPLHSERALHLVNQGFHCSQAKIDVLQSLINYCAGPKTQWLNIASS